MTSSASTRERFGACKSSPTSKPKPPWPVGPIPTWAVTVEPEASSFRPWANDSSPDWKQAAYPTAKSSSGLVPGPPSPPNSFGADSWTASRPSAVRPCPARPPSTTASVVYRIFISAPYLNRTCRLKSLHDDCCKPLGHRKGAHVNSELIDPAIFVEVHLIDRLKFLPLELALKAK